MFNQTNGLATDKNTFSIQPPTLIYSHAYNRIVQLMRSMFKLKKIKTMPLHLLTTLPPFVRQISQNPQSISPWLDEHQRYAMIYND